MIISYTRQHLLTNNIGYRMSTITHLQENTKIYQLSAVNSTSTDSCLVSCASINPCGCILHHPPARHYNSFGHKISEIIQIGCNLHAHERTHMATNKENEQSVHVVS